MTKTLDYKIVSDHCMSLVFGDAVIDETINAKVLAVYNKLSKSNLVDIHVVDLVPTYNELALHFSTSLNNNTITDVLDFVSDEIDKKPSFFSRFKTVKTHTLLVDYNGEDLDRVSSFCNLSIEDVIRLHTEPLYKIAMIGFKPHFPYLIGMDDKLLVPRLDNPRTKVPSGSVAIGGKQTGIYPVESPGGWNIIGSTDVSKLKKLSAGNNVKFKAVVR